MEKKFCPNFLPAELVKGAQGWYIKFYQTDPRTGKRKLFRLTFDLNRIKKKNLRLVRARQIINDINAMLPNGYPFTVQLNSEMYTPLEEAVTLAHRIKCQTDRQRTIETYESLQRIFLEFAGEKKYLQWKISDFSRREAVEFMDWLILKRNIGPKTYNNYLIRIKALFNTLVEREYLIENPFNVIKKKAVPTKKRRPFTEEEKKEVAAYIRKHDYWLYIAVCLLYYCYIRPIELRRLRFQHFNLQHGIISLPPEITKNKKRRNVTIPQSIMPNFLDERFTKPPINFLVFGQGMEPHLKVPCGQNSLNNRHRAVLKKLHKLGKLHNIDNLTFYSWKDTGLTDSEASLYADMQQAGHQDPRITLIYKKEKRVNEEMRNTRKRL